MASSDAPAQAIKSARSQKRPFFRSDPRGSCSSRSTVLRMGTRVKATALTAGSSAQQQATYGQQSRPKRVKAAVVRRITATQPQQ